MLPSECPSNEPDETTEQQSSSIAADASNNQENTENEGDILDPNIVSDREASMHVTSWVRENYVQERDHNVPRRNMYEHYKTHCIARQLTPVNSATFGKLIRVVFPELKTRRLGVRGQSKYHYCGIRVKPSSESHQTNDPILTITEDPRQFDDRSTVSIIAPNLSDSSVSTHLPPFKKPTIISYHINNSLDNNLISFITAYEKHCKDILISVTSHQVEEMNEIMGRFYENMPDNFRFLIRDIPEVTESVWRYDSLFFDTIIERFLPNVNYPLSQKMMLTLRTFTRELADHINTFISHFPINFYQKKLDVARIFAAKFRRHLSLNQAAQTASVILSMPDHLLAMRRDWEVFDFDGLLDQTLWVCDCNVTEIRHILNQEIYDLLTVKISLEQWMHWTSNIVDNYLNKFVPSSSSEAGHFLTQAKQFLLKWTFYASLVMKDLARQNARSFSSFNTLRLFLDEYALYLVEENIAQINYLLLKQQHTIQQAESSSSHPDIFPPSSSSTNKEHRS
ncbi:hypothetical protein CU098_009129 [Rhizopus stolonifer]|uniref:RFX-type winged-helix domain-containing protein n=1 Tax=Rhizopus stolonifer TaxID=4846 RepID=A0A367JUI7_RHIST|nr:hypothetical protein CU098_009129 [Rhizopus stolonifer]